MYAPSEVQTKYLPPTATRGSRYKASIGDHRMSVIVPSDHALDSTHNHQNALAALAAKFGFHGRYTYVCHGGTVIFTLLSHTPQIVEV